MVGHKIDYAVIVMVLVRDDEMVMMMQHWTEKGIRWWTLECLFHLDNTLASLFYFQVIVFKGIVREYELRWWSSWRTVCLPHPLYTAR